MTEIIVQPTHDELLTMLETMEQKLDTIGQLVTNIDAFCKRIDSTIGQLGSNGGMMANMMRGALPPGLLPPQAGLRR